ncbi:MAG TPA: MFS transporter [Ktedonobacterales bacterium]|nr:MFS transporter [Ktedonobacterales bacterium]
MEPHEVSHSAEFIAEAAEAAEVANTTDANTITPAVAEARPLTVPEQLTLSVLWMGINAQSAALLPIVIPTQILLFVAPGAVGNAQQATFLGWFSAGGAVVALIVPPVIGVISDHTHHPWGRRRPYIAVGTVLALLGAWALATATGVVAFALGFLIMQLGVNMNVAAYQSLVPDLVGKSQRGAASGYLGLMTIIGNIGSLALAAFLLRNVSLTSPSRGAIVGGSNAYYALTGLALLATTVITIFGVHERMRVAHPAASALVGGEAASRAPQRVAHGGWIAAWIEPWIGPWRHRNFTWVFLTRCFVMLGLTLFLTFIEYYFANVAHVANFIQATAVVALLALVGAVISSLLLGIYSDRVGRVAVVGLSTACMAAPALGFTLFQGNFPLWPLGLFFGLGYGGYTSVDWALAIDALPDANDVGKDMGIWSAASTLPAILAPALGAAVIALAAGYGQTPFGYRLVFGLATAFLLLGALCVSFIQEERPTQPRTGMRAQAHAHTQARRSWLLGWRLGGRTGGGQAHGVLRFWPFWERVMLRLYPTTAIPNAPYGLLVVRVTRYHKRQFELPDGTTIRRGDWVGEFHLHNAMLARLAAHSTSWELMRMIEGDLGALATWVEQDRAAQERMAAAGGVPRRRRARQAPGIGALPALHGVTLLGRAGARLGFVVRERPHTLGAWSDRIFMTGLLALYNPQGVQRLTQGTTRGTYPQEVWMTRTELLRRYGKGVG